MSGLLNEFPASFHDSAMIGKLFQFYKSLYAVTPATKQTALAAKLFNFQKFLNEEI